MRKFVLTMQSWLKIRRPSDAPVPYEVTCHCGRVATGVRLARHQAVPCAGCGRAVFVLPYSPLAPVMSAHASVTQAAALLARRRSPWLLPLAAASATLVVVVLIFVFVLSAFVRTKGPAAPEPISIARRLSDGQKALALGKFTLAARELDAAQAIREQNPQALSLAERKQLTQLHRQALLLSQLLSEPLGEVLRQAAEVSDVDEQEWQSQFQERYRGKAVVFDDEVRCEQGVGCQLLGQFFIVRGKPARLELAELQLLRALSLDKPQRLIFGARLASIRLAAGGTWVVYFEPDSGVLLTEPGAINACCPLPPAELREIAVRQASLIEGLP